MDNKTSNLCDFPSNHFVRIVFKSTCDGTFYSNSLNLWFIVLVNTTKQLKVAEQERLKTKFQNPHTDK